MFLDVTVNRNPLLIKTAVDLHQSGQISPNTYLLDLDVITENSRVIRESARQCGLFIYSMTKQIGRNPFASKVMIQDTEGAVAVDIECIRSLHKNGLPIGHVGHLIQLPQNDVEYVLREINSKVCTVYTLEKAKYISKIAEKLGKKQDVLIQVVSDRDFFYTNQEGGFHEEHLLDVIRVLKGFKGIRIVGVTSFPCMVFNPSSGEVEPTPNFYTILRAADKMRDEGIEVMQINAPGTNSTATFKRQAEMGATHVEPGHAFTGTTPLHAYRDLPEKPAIVYVSEVSHLFNDAAYSFGGGLFYDKAVGDYQLHCFVGNSPDSILEQKVPSDTDLFSYIGKLKLKIDNKVEVGDTVVYGFRSQIFCTRSKVAAVKGIQKGKPCILGVADRNGNLLDSHGYPLSVEESKKKLELSVT